LPRSGFFSYRPIADIWPPQPPRSNPHNIAQTGWLNTARTAVTAITFIVAVGFGSTQANAIAVVNNTLRKIVPCFTRA
jgi:hypothetical protein